MFFNFHQNNSGGKFFINDDVHINVIVEAKDYHQANHLAEKIGIYFDGIDKGEDCECCGDRWSKQYSNEEGYDVPSIYNKPVECCKKDLLVFSNSKFQIKGYVYYLNGDKEIIKEET